MSEVDKRFTPESVELDDAMSQTLTQMGIAFNSVDTKINNANQIKKLRKKGIEKAINKRLPLLLKKWDAVFGNQPPVEGQPEPQDIITESLMEKLVNGVIQNGKGS